MAQDVTSASVATFNTEDLLSAFGGDDDTSAPSNVYTFSEIDENIKKNIEDNRPSGKTVDDDFSDGNHEDIHVIRSDVEFEPGFIDVPTHGKIDLNAQVFDAEQFGRESNVQNEEKLQVVTDVGEHNFAEAQMVHTFGTATNLGDPYDAYDAYDSAGPQVAAAAVTTRGTNVAESLMAGFASGLGSWGQLQGNAIMYPSFDFPFFDRLPFVALIANFLSWITALTASPLIPSSFRTDPNNVVGTIVFQTQRLASNYLAKYTTGGLETLYWARIHPIFQLPIFRQGIIVVGYWFVMILMSWYTYVQWR